MNTQICPNKMEKLLLATDACEFCEGAVREGIGLAKVCNSKLYAVTVVEVNPEFDALAPRLAEEFSKEARVYIESVKQRAEKEGVNCETIVHQAGDAYEAIVAEAAEKKVDIIIMGRRGRQGLKRLLMGSVTANVIGHAPCDVLVVRQGECKLYELYRAFPNVDGSWNADSGAVFDLKSNALRPDTWTSADAAGLPILPGLVTYDEVASGEIRHALRFTANLTQKKHVWPARHDASSSTSSARPPMGQRFRLKASVNISSYPAPVQVIFRAFKTYGLILADNGSNWYVSGAPDARWSNDMLVSAFDQATSSPYMASAASDISVISACPAS